MWNESQSCHSLSWCVIVVVVVVVVVVVLVLVVVVVVVDVCMLGGVDGATAGSVSV